MPSTTHDIDAALNLFGKSEFRPKQREIISTALKGRPCIGVLPTGSGKSLCYQLPAVLLDRVSIVVSPLIALMKDQVDGLIKLGIKAARFDSTLPEEERQCVLSGIKTSDLKLVFVAPESLESDDFSLAVESAQLGLFVIDEAHCLSEWGHSFRPDYLSLPSYAQKRRFHSILALTATATPEVVQDLSNMFRVRESDAFLLPPTRDNIHREALEIQETEKIDFLADFLAQPDHIPSIIYARARKDTEEICAALAGKGFSAKAYHAGMPPETRMLVQNAFLSGKSPILVATIAFGMGIDKPDVRSVVHYHPPASAESYVQESGRAGRDGLPSKSLVLMNAEDIVMTRNRLYAALPDRSSLEMLFTQLLRPGNNIMSWYETTSSCDIAETALNRILFELSQEKLIAISCKGHKYYKVKPLYSIDTILAGRDEEEKAILSWLNQNRDSDIENFSVHTNMEWKSAYDYLQDLALSREWQISFRQIATVVHAEHSHEPLKTLVARYSDAFEQRLEKDLQRLSVMENILTNASCINEQLDIYFGFSGTICRHCTPCLTGHAPGDLHAFTPSPIPSEIMDDLRTLSSQNKKELARATQMTRFLLGIPGPAALRGRLWAHPLYGQLSRYPWDDIMAESFALLGK